MGKGRPSRRRRRKSAGHGATRHLTAMDKTLATRLASGARIDLGPMVMTAAGMRPAYVEGLKFIGHAMENGTWAELGFDPFAKLRLARPEMNELVTEVDDWIRVGDHAHPRTEVHRRIDYLGMCRTDHFMDFDLMPPDWARRAARIIGDLRSQLDHLVFELSTMAAERELTEKETANLSFPIEKSPERPFTLNQVRNALPLLSEESHTVIFESQPSQMPADIDFHKSVLWTLNMLNNSEKHRGLTTTCNMRITRRGANEQVFAEGELLVPFLDMTGELCEEGCVADISVGLGTQDLAVGTSLGRFLRQAYVLVGNLILNLLETEGLLCEPGCTYCSENKREWQEPGIDSPYLADHEPVSPDAHTSNRNLRRKRDVHDGPPGPFPGPADRTTPPPRPGLTAHDDDAGDTTGRSANPGLRDPNIQNFRRGAPNPFMQEETLSTSAVRSTDHGSDYRSCGRSKGLVDLSVLNASVWAPGICD